MNNCPIQVKTILNEENENLFQSLKETFQLENTQTYFPIMNKFMQIYNTRECIANSAFQTKYRFLFEFSFFAYNTYFKISTFSPIILPSRNCCFSRIPQFVSLIALYSHYTYDEKFKVQRTIITVILLNNKFSALQISKVKSFVLKLNFFSKAVFIISD